MESQALRSPCVALCKLDENEICQGCHRTIDEILSWSTASDCEKKQIIDRVATVKKAQRASSRIDELA